MASLWAVGSPSSVGCTSLPPRTVKDEGVAAPGCFFSQSNVEEERGQNSSQMGSQGLQLNLLQVETWTVPK